MGTIAVMQHREQRKSRNVRMTDKEWDDCKALGGAEFLRDSVKRALYVFNTVPAVIVDHRKKTTTLTKIEAKDLK